MTECGRPDPSLGLRGLAGIVDNERVDHRQVGDERLGPADIRQRDALARQPFKRAMRADMDQCVGLVPQPEIEGDIGVAGDTGEVVVVRIARLGRAAFGLERNESGPPADRGEGETRSGCIHILIGIAPGNAQIVLQPLRQPGEGGAIGLHWPKDAFCGQRRVQGGAGRGLMTGLAQICQDRLGRGEGVEAHGMGQVPRPPRIGGENERHAPILWCGGGEAVPRRYPIGDGVDARCLGCVGVAGELQMRVAVARLLKRGGAGE